MRAAGEAEYVRLAAAAGFPLLADDAEFVASGVWAEATNDGCVAHDALLDLAADAESWLLRAGCGRCGGDVDHTARIVRWDEGDGPRVDVFDVACLAAVRAEDASVVFDDVRAVVRDVEEWVQ